MPNTYVVNRRKYLTNDGIEFRKPSVITLKIRENLRKVLCIWSQILSYSGRVPPNIHSFRNEPVGALPICFPYKSSNLVPRGKGMLMGYYLESILRRFSLIQNATEIRLRRLFERRKWISNN